MNVAATTSAGRRSRPATGGDWRLSLPLATTTTSTSPAGAAASRARVVVVIIDRLKLAARLADTLWRMLMCITVCALHPGDLVIDGSVWAWSLFREGCEASE